MAVSSSLSSTSRSGSTLDVAGIVSQLMEVANQPITKLDSKISKSTVKISSLGMIKSQLSTLQSALTDLQTPANFTAMSAKFSADGVATATVSSSAVAGSYQMEVTQLARASIVNVSGFTTSEAALAWYTAASTDLTDVADGTVLMRDADNYVLSLKAKATGEDAGFAVDLSDFTDDKSRVVDPLSITEFTAQAAKDANFTLNGVTFTRSSNTVTDALTGVSLSLSTINADPITLTVVKAASAARPKLEAFVKAYNDLNTLYNEQTAASIDASTRGALNSDFAVGSIMRQLVSGLMQPLADSTGTYLTETDLTDTDLSDLGLEYLSAGDLAVNDTLLAAATTLDTRLAAGIRIGLDSAGGNDLTEQITAMLASGGVLQDRIESEQKVQTDLSSRKTSLQDKLVSIRARYTAQYAALDALLFKLTSTSDSLKSALDGLTASQKNN